MKKYTAPLLMLAIFETIAVSLWLVKDNLFYLFNFSYIGGSLALGLTLFAQQKPYARHIVQFLVGSYMLVYLGIICGENMQIEGFLVLFVPRGIRGSDDPLCGSQDFRTAAVRARLVRLCLLDGDGTRPPAVPDAAGTAQRGFRKTSLADLCACAGVCRIVVYF